MKFITKNGFTLIETILSLWITTLSLFLFTSSISILKSYKYDDFIIEDANFINQIQLIYALGENKTIENGWSVNVLAHQIDTNLYARQIEKKKNHLLFL